MGTLESSLGISRERKQELQDHHKTLMKEGNIIDFLESMCKFCENPNEILYVTIQLGANLHRTPKEFFRHSGSPETDQGSSSSKGTKVSENELSDMLRELGMSSDDIPGLNDSDEDQNYGMKRRDGDKPSFSNDVDD